MEINITNENFKKEVLDSQELVIVDFYGTWCMPCKMLAPIVEKVCSEKNIKLAKVDIDENMELVKEYKPYGLEQNKKIAKMGGDTAKVAKEDLEKKLGRKVITNQNKLNYDYVENKKIEN